MMLTKISRVCLHRNGVCPQNLSRPSSSLMPDRLFMSSSLHHAPVKSTTFNANTHNITYQSFNHKHNSYQLQSLAFSTKTRRRRRQGGGIPHNPMEDDSSDSSADNNSTLSSTSATGNNSAALSSEQFLSASTSLLDRMESVITKLKDCNEGLEISRYPPSLPSSSTNSTDNDTDENENQQHGGQLSIQVESTGDLYWGGGTYLLTIHPDNNADSDDALSGSGSNGGFATLQSPLSGSFTYGYNASTGEWVGNEDGHSMIGMFTRDWIRQCRGVPDF
mmetsp:Transcript_25412/g.45898  ORF Transcript_25412/g.45898 Transcript_25412/m.45898 type:complete len:277 (-) Transcript_25412:306-1136(-)